MIYHIIGLTGLAIIGPLIALILIAVRASGQARFVGIIGAGLMLLGGLLQALGSAFLPVLVYRYHLSASDFSLILIPFNLISVVGIVLIGLAVGMGRTATVQRR